MQRFTQADLALFDGRKNPQNKIFISLSGVVYDVTSAPQFYGYGAAYHVYAAKESGRALGM